MNKRQKKRFAKKRYFKRWDLGRMQLVTDAIDILLTYDPSIVPFYMKHYDIYMTHGNKRVRKIIGLVDTDEGEKHIKLSFGKAKFPTVKKCIDCTIGQIEEINKLAIYIKKKKLSEIEI